MITKLLSHCLHASLVSPGVSRPKFVAKKIAQRALGAITKIHDPMVEIRLGERTIRAPLSHNLPNLLSEFPHYDRALPRIARAVAEAQGSLRMIDVGANVGDTVNMVDQAVSGEFLCVEPSPHFFPMLEANTRAIPGVVLENVGAGESDEVIKGYMQEHRGSTRIRDTAEAGMAIATLDTLTERHPAFKRTNLLKIDTDGFDYKTIRGARRLLESARPVIYFELSPDHMIHVGHEDPMAIFPFLAARGYSHLLIYDQHGYPIAPVNIRETETVRGILGYAHRKIYYWLDVLAVHETQRELFDCLVAAEYAAIPEFVRPYFR